MFGIIIKNLQFILLSKDNTSINRSHPAQCMSMYYTRSLSMWNSTLEVNSILFVLFTNMNLSHFEWLENVCAIVDWLTSLKT